MSGDLRSDYSSGNDRGENIFSNVDNFLLTEYFCSELFHLKGEIQAVNFHPGFFFLRRLNKKIQLLKSTIAWFQCELTVFPEYFIGDYQ